MSDGTYGVPRIHAELAADGIRIGRKRVARLMRRAHLSGVRRRRFVVTTTPGAWVAPSPDLVKREFKVDGPDMLWVADITYVPTWAGFLYLAVVLDVWSRRVVGWAMANHLRTELVLDALPSQVEARRAIFEYIEGWYNLRRRHSSLGYLSLVEFEREAGRAA
jgi:putative transposase